jgi:hypothetical protein
VPEKRSCLSLIMASLEPVPLVPRTKPIGKGVTCRMDENHRVAR